MILNWQTDPVGVFAHGLPNHVHVWRGPDELTLELTPRKRVNLRSPLTAAYVNTQIRRRS
jgi:hypothetical protein